MIPLRDPSGRILRVSERSVDAWVSRGYRKVESVKPEPEAEPVKKTTKKSSSTKK